MREVERLRAEGHTPRAGSRADIRKEHVGDRPRRRLHGVRLYGLCSAEYRDTAVGVFDHRVKGITDFVDVDGEIQLDILRGRSKHDRGIDDFLPFRGAGISCERYMDVIEADGGELVPSREDDRCLWRE